MHVRVRMFGKPETIIVVDSKLTKIERFREIIRDKFDVHPNLQRLFYGGKLLEDGYNFHDYNIKLNDVIQLTVKSLPKQNTTNNKKTPEKEDTKEIILSFNENEIIYKDASSTLYEVGDLIDVKDADYGAWFEGEIVRIVLDPKLNYETEEDINTRDKCDVLQTRPSNEENISNNNSIKQYFPKVEKDFLKKESLKIQDDNILYKVQVDYDGIENMVMYCNLKAIRPRARTVIDAKDLKVGQTVMVNYDIESPSDKGFWYDLKIDKIKKSSRHNYELIGTLYVALDSAPQLNTKVDVHDKIFAIEKPVPLAERSKEYKKLMKLNPTKRTKPPTCYQCYDDPESTCRECGCYQCSLKTSPEKIILCDECNRGYHISCLSPPLTEIPEEDWYCPLCKRDPNEVVAPGGAKQTKKTNISKTNRDWGRGMACAGKTKTCAMPANHFGPIPGIEVGMCWRFRIQLSESGVHRPPVSGIHGRDCEGAYSIVLSGGYEDDVDHGNEFTYTGSGGRDLSGNRRTAEQSCDQKLTRENKALARNCAVKEVSEDGGDAGKDWKQGKPVRVVRSYKMLKHFPKFAPKEGIRYDGIYKVVKYYPEKGLSGYRVWKYLLRRDDPNPAPWEKGAKHFPIVYPDGYLEAEAEKNAQKNKKGKGSKKRVAADSEQSSSNSDTTPPPSKKRKLKNDKPGTSKKTENSEKAVQSMFTRNKKNEKKDTVLNVDEKIAIESDTVNTKLWAECLEVIEKQGKKEFIEHVTQVFLCIICQDLVVNPFTTPCLHNFCMACIKLAFKSTESKACPCCRQSVENVELLPNENLKAALRSILPGYDAGKK